MTRRIVQLEITGRNTRAFAREVARINRSASETGRAQHETQRSALTTAYRIERSRGRS